MIAGRMDGALQLPARSERSLRFEYLAGGTTPLTHPHETGWRQHPGFLVAHIDFAASVLFAEGDSPLDVAPGQTLCLPLERRHRIVMTSTWPAISRWSHVRFPLSGGVDLLSLLTIPAVLGGDEASELGRINECLAGLAFSQSLEDVCQRWRLGFALLSHLARRARWLPGAVATLDGLSRLAPALAWIEEHIEAVGGREALAHMVHLSSSRFCAVFRQVVGQSFTAYRLAAGMRRACELLLESDLSIAEVARRSGWRDPCHFSRYFRRQRGCTPQAYRSEGRRF